MEICRFLIALLLAISISDLASSQTANYTPNRYPLADQKYMQLPLGAIKAKGWLQEMLVRQRDGSTGQLDALYPQVMGDRNGWLGGDGDQWERGPYWIDGLLPLAYLLDDTSLKEKAQRWVECILASQRPDGSFGPTVDYPFEPGLQRDNAADWWPRMVALKILQQYYSATSDKRVINFLSAYFRYQLATLPDTPLGHWTFWADHRAGDNMQVVYWLYNITGENYLLDLAELIHKQKYDFEGFIDSGSLANIKSIHCVNLAQQLKEPALHYMQSHDSHELEVVDRALQEIKVHHGQAQGMYGGDEAMHGNDPTQGSELCSAVEMMFSLETILPITGDVRIADYLERVAFNALPTQITDDFMYKQYFQQANQIAVTRAVRNFYEDDNHDHTDLVFGSISGYSCCYSNMHQGWPKLVQNLWYATPDGGLAALVYSPSEVTAMVADSVPVTITETTAYPMDETITFNLSMPKMVTGVEFPLHLRVPEWCSNPEIAINGKPVDIYIDNGIAVFKRNWSDGDQVSLKLPMAVKSSRWHEHSVAIERGPLVFALKMQEDWRWVDLEGNDAAVYGDGFYEVTSPSKWNFGLLDEDVDRAEVNCQVLVDDKKMTSDYFWNPENAPVEIRIQAQEVPDWHEYNAMAGPIPFSSRYLTNPVQEITLIPYGCTTLRISQFPSIRK